MMVGIRSIKTSSVICGGTSAIAGRDVTFAPNWKMMPARPLVIKAEVES
jgi:hypothetical protein